MCQQFHQLQYITSWTGFNIQVLDQFVVMKFTVHYLDCLDTPATETATMQEVMERVLKMKDARKISETVCKFDKSIFEKAAEIKWKSLSGEVQRLCIGSWCFSHDHAIYVNSF